MWAVDFVVCPLIVRNVAQHKIVNELKTWDLALFFFFLHFLKNHSSMLFLSVNFVEERAVLQFPKVRPAGWRVL